MSIDEMKGLEDVQEAVPEGCTIEEYLEVVHQPPPVVCTYSVEHWRQVGLFQQWVLFGHRLKTKERARAAIEFWAATHDEPLTNFRVVEDREIHTRQVVLL